MLELHEIDEGIQEALVIRKKVSPLVTPERLAELHEQGLLASPPQEIEGGTLLIPKEGQTIGSLKHYLLDIGGPTDFRA